MSLARPPQVSPPGGRGRARGSDAMKQGTSSRIDHKISVGMLREKLENALRQMSTVGGVDSERRSAQRGYIRPGRLNPSCLSIIFRRRRRTLHGSSLLSEVDGRMESL